jgi:Na+/proline symporter
VQFAIMMVGVAAYAVVVVTRVGGLEAMQERLARVAASSSALPSPEQLLAFTPDRAAHAGAAVLFVIGLQWLVQINADGTGYLAQRTMACRSDADATRAAVVFTVLQIVLRSLLWLPIALGLILLYPIDQSASLDVLRAQREVTFVSGIKDLLPPGVQGLMLTGMLAALASTVDTHLNWGASYFTHDLYRRFVCRVWLRRTPSGRELVWVARGSNLLILLIAMVVMTQLSSIQHAWHTSLLFGAGLGPLLLLRWVWWRVTARGEIAAIVASTVLAPALLAFGPQSEALRLLVMGGATTTVGVVASLVWGPEPMDRLKEFYLRTRAPGFWGPIAERSGEPAVEARQRLGRGVTATLLGSLSVFCLLTGIGSWLIGSPAPKWCPSRPLWVLGLIVISVGVTPWVWRLGLRGQSSSDSEEKE